MRRLRFQGLIAVLSLCALLGATGQYLSHFHVPRSDVAAANTSGDQAHLGASGHQSEKCALCLQFDRLPAPPALLRVAPTVFHVVGLVAPTPRVEFATAPRGLWPPSRAPPVLA
jgi:hypothetical protein